MLDPVRQEVVASAHTIVVKIGTGVLTHPDATLDVARVHALVEDVSAVLETGRKVLIVSSGAIGAGLGQLALKRRPSDLPHLQAAAAIGQSYLMRAYDESLRKHGYHAAQILLTAADFEDRARYLNVRNTILTLFDYKSVPIINENDTVSVDEIRFGDNDRLAAMVTNLLRAPLLVILSVVEGLYSGDPGGTRKTERARHLKRKTQAPDANRTASRDGSGASASVVPLSASPPPALISTVESIDDGILKLAGASRSQLGTGGMTSKLQAAQMCTLAGESVWIVGGKRSGVLREILAAKPIGTLFLAQGGSLASRKRWIGLTVRPRGRYVVDAGARRALEKAGKSLLAIGVLEVVGDFDTGDVVTICDPLGVEFARGLTNYSAADARKIRGLRTPQIQAALGFEPYDEVIHRDNLVVTSATM
jgi:glutamate 5-kinase